MQTWASFVMGASARPWPKPRKEKPTNPAIHNHSVAHCLERWTTAHIDACAQSCDGFEGCDLAAACLVARGERR